MDVETLNHYKLHEKIGEGLNGTVYKAWDTQQNRQVALKILKPFGIETINKQIWHNIKKLSEINHLNLVPIYKIEQDEDKRFIVTKLIEGKTLKDLILYKQTDDLKPFELLEKIIAGLSELQKHGFVHGNLKPSNIIISDEGEVMLMDAFLSPFENFQIKPEFIIPYEDYHYVSPEQINCKDISIKSDFFTVGIIIYQLLTGRLPFTGNNEEDLTESIINKQPDYDILKSVSINSIRLLIIQKLLSKNPLERFFDSSELINTLKELSDIDSDLEKIDNNITAGKNPRRYLLVPILIALVFILWFILSSSRN